MASHTLKDWLIAVRPWSFPASAMPVVVGSCYTLWSGWDFSILHAFWALAAIILFQAAGNTWSDYFDYRSGVDTAQTHGSVSIVRGMFRPGEILRLSIVLLSIAVLLGVGLLWRVGLPLLWIGLGGLICTLAYPVMKAKALGDLTIFVSYALLPLLGTVYVTSGRWEPSVLWLSIPIGLLTVAILHVNNIRDSKTDKEAGIHTLAMLAGERVSVLIYRIEILVPFVATLLLIAFGILPPWSLLCLLALPPALANLRSIRRYACGEDTRIQTLDEQTAKLQLAYSLLLSGSLVLAALL